MTTSGSTDYTRTALQVVGAALRKLRVLAAGATATGGDLTDGLEALNLMLKAWQLDDITLWCLTEAVLHLEKDGQTYTLGPSGDHFCAASDAVKTELTAAVAAGGVALTVTSNTGIVNADAVGVELDDGTLHWSTQNGAPAGATDLTLAAGLTSAASAGAVVFAYTSKIARPIEILEARLRDVDDNDTPLDIDRSSVAYMQRHTDKTATGDVRRISIVPTIGGLTLYTWPACDDVTTRIFCTVQRVIEDLDASGNTLDLPAECLEAVIFNLSVRLGPEFRVAVPDDVKAFAAYGYEMIRSRYASKDPVQFRPPAHMRWRR